VIIIIRKYYIISCFISIILGIILHFAFKLTNNNILVGLITPVNESVWEHLKLILLPLTLFALVTKIIYKYKNIMIATSIATIISCVLILFIHYTFLFFNIESMTIDILAYIISIILAFYITYIFHINKLLIKYEWLGYVLITTLFIIFAVFTIFTPKHQLFLDKTLNIYGIPT